MDKSLIKTDSFKTNKIIQAYENGDSGCILEKSQNNPFRLHRFKKKYGVEVTGKEIDGQYIIVFWNKLKTNIKSCH
mgnify:CR=1 FL=1|jgi:hypothetical protein